MKYSIATFADIRNFKQNQIPVSTCHSDPKWFNSGYYNKEIYYVDKRGIMIGIREPSLSPSLNLSADEMCRKECPHRGNPNGCAFLIKYEKEINKINFKWLTSEMERVAEDVRKVTHYEGEPEIVFIVYEVDGNPCSERYAIKRLFESNKILLPNWEKEIIDFPIPPDDELPF